MKVAVLSVLLALLVVVFAQQPSILNVAECAKNVILMRAQVSVNPEFKDQVLQSYFAMTQSGTSSISEEEAVQITNRMFDETKTEEEACASVLNLLKNHSVKSAKTSFSKECPKMVESFRSSFGILQQYAPKSLETYYVTSSATLTRLGYTAKEALPLFKNKVVNEETPVESVCEEITEKYAKHFASQYAVQSDDPLFSAFAESDFFFFPMNLHRINKYTQDAVAPSPVPEKSYDSKGRINPASLLNPLDDNEENEEEESERSISPADLLRAIQSYQGIYKPSSDRTYSPLDLLRAYRASPYISSSDRRTFNPLSLLRAISDRPNPRQKPLSDEKDVKKMLAEELAEWCKKKKNIHKAEYWLVCKSKSKKKSSK